MPIIRGFPPSNTISPSVRITEKDLSFYTTDSSVHRLGLVGFCSKGPINMPTLIQTKRDLNITFGYPHPDVSDPYLIYAAEQYLLVANELYVVRVADDQNVSDEKAATAAVDAEAAGGQVVIKSDSAGDYTFADDSFFRWRLNGVIASKTLVVLAGVYTCEELVTALNAQLTPYFDGIVFDCSVNDKLNVSTVWAYGPDASLELVSVQDAMYDEVGIGTAMIAANMVSSADRYPDDSYTVAGTWDFTGLTNLNLQIVVDGTDNVLIDNVIQTVDLGSLEGLVNTTADVVNAINDAVTNGDVPGGFIALVAGDNFRVVALHVGRDSKLLIKSSSTAGDILSLDHVTHVGTSPEGSTDDAAVYTYGIVYGSTNTLGTISLEITADSAGIEGNNTQVDVINDPSEGTFSMIIYNNGVEVESWGYLTMDSTSRYYVETYISLVSDYIRVTNPGYTNSPPRDGTYTLIGGSDGIPSDPDDQDTLLIGSNIGYTGMYALSDPEQIEIDILAVPGHSSTSVIDAMIDMCGNVRMDCMCIVDPPFGLTVSEIVQWQNGTHPLNDTRFDSDFAALYWPWVKIRDTYNKVDVWVPPSGSICAVYARNDALGQPWFAPAGASRGIVPGIADVFNRPTLEERDSMYGNRNCVNPIVQFVDLQDFTVWGQKTMQRRPTALDRVNVRRLMFTIEKRIKKACRGLLFEPHDDVFHQQFTQISGAILEEIKIGRGLYDYIIKADWELNTPDVVDRNEFRARIGVQPVKAVEFIFIEFSIHRTGSWTEDTEQPYTS
jgi:hypothetical protein